MFGVIGGLRPGATFALLAKQLNVLKNTMGLDDFTDLIASRHRHRAVAVVNQG